MKLQIKKKSRTQNPKEPMTLVGHLNELRKRLMWCIGSVVVGIIIVWIFFDPIFAVLESPYCQYAEDRGRECKFLVSDILEEFNVKLSISGYGGLILAMPMVLYQIGRFVMPALYPKERRTLLPFVGVGVVFFGTGVVGAYYLMPAAFEILLNIGPDSFEEFLSGKRYLDFFIKMSLAFGFAAEFPLVLVFLQKVGVISTETLRKNRRIAVVLVFILGAVITPTGDPLILCALAIPMYILYEVSIIIGARFKSQRDRIAQTENR